MVTVSAPRLCKQKKREKSRGKGKKKEEGSLLLLLTVARGGKERKGNSVLGVGTCGCIVKKRVAQGQEGRGGEGGKITWVPHRADNTPRARKKKRKKGNYVIFLSCTWTTVEKGEGKRESAEGLPESGTILSMVPKKD